MRRDTAPGSLFRLVALSILLFGYVGCGQKAAKEDVADLLAAGWHWFRINEYAYSIKAFEEALEAAGQDPEAQAEACYGLGSAWDFRRPGDFRDKALEFYNRAVDAAPASDAAAWSLLAVARMKHLATVGLERDQKNTPEVRAAYQEVIDRFPDHLTAEEAFIYLQSCRVVTLKPEELGKAAVALEEFVRTHPDSLFKSTAYHLLAECYMMFYRHDDRIRAKRMALELAEEDKVTPMEMNKALFTWLIAVYAEFDAGDFEIAREYYRRLIDEYPTDNKVYMAKLALKRLDEVEARIRRELLDQGLEADAETPRD